jgi:hypothetical protein
MSAFCHKCGAPERITTTEYRNDRDGVPRPSAGISHCSVNPAHDVGEPFLSQLRAILGPAEGGHP